MLDFSFDFKKGNFHINIQESLPTEGVTAIFGPSGCGKTSLLRALAGLDYYSTSTIKMNETTWQDGSLTVPTHQRNIGFIFQEPNLFPHLTVEENLKFGLIRTLKNLQKIDFKCVVSVLNIEDFSQRDPHQLSKGQKQRVAIGRALLSSPKILLMDEPLSGLDTQSKSEIIPYLEKVSKQFHLPIIFVTHDLAEISQFTDQVLFLDNGRSTNFLPITEAFNSLNSPLNKSHSPQSIIETKIDSHDEGYFLTYLSFPGGKITVPMINKSIGENLKIRVPSQGVSITLKKAIDTSVQNILSGTVEEIKLFDQAKVYIQIDCEGVKLIAAITKKSLDELKLQKGLNIYIQIKSVEILT
ncbi:MAG: molybdenum ABC transporter ATP-binding protein [Lentisphaeraceae bacterium]|nr:molybdenum ABC transporter ATP-binding protein [Lentisphaeraceae bacterium]